MAHLTSGEFRVTHQNFLRVIFQFSTRRRTPMLLPFQQMLHSPLQRELRIRFLQHFTRITQSLDAFFRLDFMFCSHTFRQFTDYLCSFYQFQSVCLYELHPHPIYDYFLFHMISNHMSNFFANFLRIFLLFAGKPAFSQRQFFRILRSNSFRFSTIIIQYMRTGGVLGHMI